MRLHVGSTRASPVSAYFVQASLLCEALVETRQSYLLADAYREAWTRGEAWQEGDPVGPRINARQRQARVGKCPWRHGRQTG
ncbi:hypothetical protein AGR1B_Lc10024 [Agrobacterium fabacearum S56]|nr:hypothetical protein AGR1B_Lc10024 [Agrobacterium fabacearum S56]